MEVGLWPLALGLWTWATVRKRVRPGVESHETKAKDQRPKATKQLVWK